MIGGNGASGTNGSHLRPLSVGEVLDVSFKLYRTFFKTLTKSVAVVVAPLYVVEAIVLISILPRLNNTSSTVTQQYGTYTTTSTQSDVTAFLTIIGAGVMILVVQWLAMQLSIAACCKTIGDGYLGLTTSASEAIRFTSRRLASVIAVALLVALAAGSLALITFFVLGAAGIWLWVCWSVAIPVLLLEGRPGVESLSRSFQLVRGRWWPTFGTLLAQAIISVIIYYVVQYSINIPAALLLHDQSILVVPEIIAMLLATMIATPFSASVITVMYFDLQVRKEGLDLVLLANQLGISPGASPGTSPQGPYGWPPGAAPQGPYGWPAPPGAGAPSPGGWPAPPGALLPPPGALPPPPGAFPPPPGPPPDVPGTDISGSSSGSGSTPVDD